MIFGLYIFRVLIRDLVMPISEIPQLFLVFERSKNFYTLIMTQAFIFDLSDFLVSMVTLGLFYKSGKAGWEQKHQVQTNLI